MSSMCKHNSRRFIESNKLSLPIRIDSSSITSLISLSASLILINDNISSITAIANDYGFEQIFSRQIQTYGNKNDLLIAISTSGNSINVINAVKAAIEKKIAVVIFTGENAGKMNDFDCLKLKIKSKNVARIQEMHILVGHIICKYVEENIL